MNTPVDDDGKPSAEDIVAVQFCVEQCILQYMNKTETVHAHASWGDIQPKFTEIVWEKLEESNRVFFRAYYTKLLVWDRVKKFDSVLQEHQALMGQSEFTHIQTGLSLSRSNIFPTRQFLMSSPAQVTLPMIAMGIRQVNWYNSDGWSTKPFVQGSLDAIKSGFSPNMLSQNSNIGWRQTVNGQIFGSHFNICQPNEFVESDALMDLLKCGNRPPLPATGTNYFAPSAAADEMLDLPSEIMGNPFGGCLTDGFL